MAITHDASGATGLSFGLSADEGTLITNKVKVSRKVKKKDLRGRQGGYKAIASYNKSVEVSIDGAVTDSGVTDMELGASETLGVDEFSLGVSFFVESITYNEKNEDFKTCSIKLVGNENFG